LLAWEKDEEDAETIKKDHALSLPKKTLRGAPLAGSSQELQEFKQHKQLKKFQTRDVPKTDVPKKDVPKKRCS